MRAAGKHSGVLYPDRRRHLRVAEGKETPYRRPRLHPGTCAARRRGADPSTWQADRWGNLTFRDSARNFNPVMAMAGVDMVQSQHVMPLGEIEPMQVMTRGCYRRRVLHVPYNDLPGSVL